LTSVKTGMSICHDLAPAGQNQPKGRMWPGRRTMFRSSLNESCVLTTLHDTPDCKGFLRQRYAHHAALTELCLRVGVY